jgi:hypothetical protein
MLKSLLRFLVWLLLLCLCAPALNADSLDDLSREFWQWRALEQPLSSDDVTRDASVPSGGSPTGRLRR